MNDTEQRLAAWLREADPQPPRLLTFADIVAAVGGTRTANVQLLRSVDQGAHFATVAPPLRQPAEGPQSVGVLDQSVWVISTPYVHRSADGGLSWTTTRLTQPVSDIQLAGPTAATGISSADCSSNEPDGCQTTNYLVSTTDGGRTWHSS